MATNLTWQNAKIYDSVVSSPLLAELGEVNCNWFEDLTDIAKNGSRQKETPFVETALGTRTCRIPDLPVHIASGITGETFHGGNSTHNVGVGVQEELPSSTPGSSRDAPTREIDIPIRGYTHHSGKLQNDNAAPEQDPENIKDGGKDSNAVHSHLNTSTPKIGDETEWGATSLLLKDNCNVESPIGPLTSTYDNPVHGVEKHVVTPKFSTPRFSPWWGKEDGNPMPLSLENSDDFESLLIKAWDSEELNNGERNDLDLCSQASTLKLSGSNEILSKEFLQSTRSMQSEKGFLKELLQKTPASLKLGNVRRLKEALGVDPSHSGISWTSSLATPPKNKDTDVSETKATVESPVDLDDRHAKGAARKLFSPGSCDTDGEEVALNSTTEGTPVVCNDSDRETYPTSKDASPSIECQTKPKNGLQDNRSADQPVEEPKKVKDELDGAHLSFRKHLTTQISVDFIDDLIGTPPSRTSLRKPPPKKRASKRHSLDCSGATSKLLETLMSKESKLSSTEDSPIKVEICDAATNIICDNVSSLSLQSGARKGVSQSTVGAHEFEFTQLSPSSLSAICDAAIVTDTGAQKQLLTELNSSSGQKLLHMGTEVTKDGTSADENKNTIDVAHGTKTSETPVGSEQENDDLLFSQISPTAMDSLFSATDALKTPDMVTECVEKKPDVISFGTKEHVTPNSAMPQKLKTSKGRSIGLHRRPGRFLYPTSHQITSSGPSKVINYQVLACDDKAQNKERKLNPPVQASKSVNDALVPDTTKTPTLNVKDAETRTFPQIGEHLHKSMDFTRLSEYGKEEMQGEILEDGNSVQKSMTGKETQDVKSSACDQIQHLNVTDSRTNYDNVDCDIQHGTPITDPVIPDTDSPMCKPQSTMNTELHGFQCASGKKIEVKEGDLIKYAQWFEEDLPGEQNEDIARPYTGARESGTSKELDIDVPQEPSTNKVQNNNSYVTPGFVGFKTAAGFTVKMDDSKLSKYKKWFDEDFSENETELLGLRNENRTDSLRKDQVTRCEFKEGGISLKGSLKNESEKLHDGDPQPTATAVSFQRGELTAKNDANPLQTHGFVGFKTAAGFSVKIDDSKLSKYKTWFDEDFSEKETEVVGLKDEKNSPTFKKGKVRKLVSGDEEISIKRNVNETLHNFPTSESDMDTLPTREYGRVTDSKFVGFKTAAGKDLEIDSSVMWKYEQWFEDNPDENLKDQPPFDTQCGQVNKKLGNDGKSCSNMDNYRVEQPHLLSISSERQPFKKVSEGRNMGKTVTATLKASDPINDYSKLPKGYRPFKRPQMIGNPTSVMTDSNNHVQVNDTNPSHESKKISAPHELMRDKAEDSHYDEFNDSLDSFSYTQITEAASAAEVLALEDDSQFDDPVPRKQTVVATETGSTKVDIALRKFEGSLTGAPTSVMFSTASGKGIHTSAEALARVRDLLEETDIDPIGHSISDYDVTLADTSVQRNWNDRETSSNNGHLQASNRDGTPAVKQGTSAPKSESKILNNVETLPCHNRGTSTHDAYYKEKSNNTSVMSSDNPAIRSPPGEELEKSTPSLGFSTAGGKAVLVSKTALEKAKSLLEQSENSDISNPIGEETSYNSTVSHPLGQGSVKPTPAHGFSTASGKKVSVSQKRLEKARSILEETSDNPAVGNPSEEGTGKFEFEFSTAGGKAVSVSKTALEEARSLFEESFEDSALSNPPEKGKPTSFVGFSTAGGKAVSVSKTALEKTRSLFEEQSENSTVSIPVEEGSGKHTSFVGFSTAGGKAVSVSKRALEKTRSLFEEQSENSTVSIPVEEGSGKPTSFVGFSTAGGKSVPVSKRALEKTRSLFEEQSENTTVSIPVVEGSGKPTSTFGFSTAGGKSVPVSKRALEKTRSLFEEQSENTTVSIPVEEGSGKPTSFVGFSTAGGKAVSVSKTALEEAKSLFEEQAENTTVNIPVEEGSGKPTSSVGFSTAGGKAVSVSKMALEKTRSLFEEQPENSTVSIPVEEGSGKPTSSFGFSTAGGKAVLVSKTALEKAKSLLEERSENSAVVHPPEKGSGISRPSQGFSTAGGKAVSVSKMALEKAKLLFEEQPQNSTLSNPVEEGSGKPTSSVGFSTAGDKAVSVSKTALEKAKSLFEEQPENSTVSNPVGEGSGKPRSSVGFSTAGGKVVSVTNTALEEAKSFFEDPSENKTIGNFPEEHSVRPKPSVGFSTAAGKLVATSRTALEKVRTLFDDPAETSYNDLSSATIQSEISKSCLAFTKASGRAAPVSEEALKEAKSLLADSTESQNTNKCLMGISDSLTSNGSVTRDCGRGEGNVASNAFERDNNKLAVNKDRECLVQDTHKAVKYNDQPLTEDYNVLMEISESSKALLADGDETFEESISYISSSVQRTYRQGFSRVHSAPNRTLDRPGMKPVSTVPEAYVTDRWVTGRSRALRPVISTPDKDLISERSDASHFQQQGLSSTKDLERTLTKQFGENLGASKTISKPISQSTPVKSADGSFSTPYKITPNQASSFRPPINTSTPSAEGFKAPHKTGKRTAREAELISPLPKKNKVEDSNNDLSVQGQSLEDDLLEDWGQEHDSMTEALSSVDLENIEQRCEEENAERSGSPYANVITSESPLKVKLSAEVTKARMKAKVSQGQRIRVKREKGGVKPLAGSWFSQRANCVGVKLKDAVGGLRPRAYSRQQLYSYGVRKSILAISSATAEDFRFSSLDFYNDHITYNCDSVKLGDGATLVWDDCSTAGKEEFCNALLDMVGVDPKLTDREWIYNHYRWTVWKLASMEKSFPGMFGGRCLTPERVMLQLKYRYDREVDNSQRSAVKKIFERDDTPAKVIVLCVSRVINSPDTPLNQITKLSSGAGDGEAKKPASTNAIVELTDGWYAIKALLDAALTRLLGKNKLNVGDKLIISGAELVGSQDAAPPLQAPGDTMLKISANSCRRACWYARLGYHFNPQPVPLPLSSLYSDGGNVSVVDVVVTRVYPLLYMERCPDGGTLFRPERAEQRAARKAESNHQKLLETIYSKVQTEFEKKASGKGRRSSLRGGRRYTKLEIGEFTTGEEIYEALQGSTDQSHIESALSQEQLAMLTQHQMSKQEELHSEMQAEFKAKLEEFEGKNPKRNVTPLLKVRLSGCSKGDFSSKSHTVLTIWRPSDDTQETLREGKRFHIYHLSAAESRGRIKGNAVALTAQRMTRYRNVPIVDSYLNMVFQPRKVTHFCELLPAYSPAYYELDCVGIVILASAAKTFDKASGDEGLIQTLYMADREGNIASVKAWGGLEAYGLNELLKEKSTVAMSNVSWRTDSVSRSKIPTLCISEATIVTENPKESHLKKAIEQLKTDVKSAPDFVSRMQEKLHSLFNVVGSTPQQVERSKTRTDNLITPRSKPGRTAPRSVVYSTSQPKMTPNSQQLPSMEDGSNKDTRPMDRSSAGDLGSPALKPLDGPYSGSLAPSLTPSSQPATTPGPLSQTPRSDDDGDIDPVVAKKRALQRMKTQRVSQYADQTPVTPLYGSIPSKLRRAFKVPTLTRSASANLEKAEYLNVISRTAVSSPVVPSSEKLHRKLDFSENDVDVPCNSPATHSSTNKDTDSRQPSCVNAPKKNLDGDLGGDVGVIPSQEELLSSNVVVSTLARVEDKELHGATSQKKEEASQIGAPESSKTDTNIESTDQKRKTRGKRPRQDSEDDKPRKRTSRRTAKQK